MKAFSTGVLALVLPHIAAAQSVTSIEDFNARQGNKARPMMNCTIKPLRVVEVNSILDGVVDKVFVEPGARVAPGDPLVELNSALARAELRIAELTASSQGGLAAAETRFQGAKKREARLAEGVKRKAVSVADHEDALLELSITKDNIQQERERLDLAAVEVERARTLIELSTIRAQVAGVVGEDLVDPGEGTAGRPVATIYVNQPLRVETFVPSAQLSALLQRETFEIFINDGAPQPVQLDYVAQLADLASNTVSVFFKLDAPDVLPGSKCLMPMQGTM
ncbi:efflux RND transporter periplasmic adaptor subunit [Actibacterium pelagium]|uniref:RND efflux pump membrane fusion protein barrel-sandwich domain-containing protein n=1 Tax=Actibacterium pelagium TaxID=2029103 RepID=A0A917ABL9_9RHOB|nr:HlyD family efflux transporter periplasmic adaptor subunit [Actibacterium pelagium]GGE38870.1 hypothetical protein GCM10011517_03290 [Actibacterium pelagium]